jgi:putative addiction module component (TIGR02574 family)
MPTLSFPLDKLTVAEKVALIEQLWASLDEAQIESPAWHAEVLREREEKIASGQAKFIPWEQAKTDILRETSS